MFYIELIGHKEMQSLSKEAVDVSEFLCNRVQSLFVTRPVHSLSFQLKNSPQMLLELFLSEHVSPP